MYRRPLMKDLYIFVGDNIYRKRDRTIKNALRVKRIYIPEDCYQQTPQRKNKGERATEGKKEYSIICPVLLELKSPINLTLSNGPRPVCLPVYETVDPKTERTSTVGWGSVKAKRQ
ncbi:hypothetical protein SK128_018996, partial [Halocaridina rubra]